MPVELKVPTVGESITKVLIGAWHKSAGDRAEKDQGLVEIETDKATIELPAPITGTITKVLKKEGDSATVGEVIGYMEESAVAAKATKAAPAAPAATAAPHAAPVPTSAQAAGVEPRVMPAARRALAEQNLQPQSVAATGPGGRLLKEDVLHHTEQQSHAGATGDHASAQGDHAAARGDHAGRPADSRANPKPVPKPALTAHDADGREEEAVPMTPLRRRVAERLVAAQQTAALLTTFNEIDMSAIMALRKQYQDAFVQKHSVKLGFMSFFIKAAIDALKQFPQVNAEIRDLPDTDGRPAPHIVYRNYYDIGVAVGGGKGLVVPVLRGAERLSFAELEVAIADFGARARDNKLKLEELYGGTFTISNGGVYGSLMSTPIVNPPQSGILGLHAIQDRPVARDGQIVIRPMMYVAFTYDHRVIDGREAVTFLKRIKESIEEPARMLIEV